ncbi:hypothetical protein ACFYOI_05185 [Streptomyces microflavus]|uniref:hypothetical protein n=1 Tax=Streptomyces microflavus TaxID=1919 RepID=UPI0033A365EF
MSSAAPWTAAATDDWIAGFPLMTVIPGSDGSATAGGAAAGGSSDPSALISAVEEASRSKTSWASGLNSLVSGGRRYGQQSTVVVRVGVQQRQAQRQGA